MARYIIGLRLVYSYVQIVLYRPFVAHLGQCPGQSCLRPGHHSLALSCLEACRDIIRVAIVMKQRNFLDGDFWITVLAILTASMVIEYSIGQKNWQDDHSELQTDARNALVLLAFLAQRSTSCRCISLALMVMSIPSIYNAHNES